MPLDSQTPDDATAVVRLTTPLAAADALAAFTDTDRLARWYWPARLAPRYTGSLTVAGVLHARSDVADMGFTATVTATDESGFACDWQWDGDEDVTTVRVEVTAAESGGSVVTVIHAANPSVQARDDHEAGWRSCLERLDAARG